VRIVSLAQNVPGPVAVARLVRDGASAVKVEPPSGDQLARICSGWYHELHAGIRVERLDLKSAAGMSALEALLPACDLSRQRRRRARPPRPGRGQSEPRFPSLRHLSIVGDTAIPRSGHDLTHQAVEGLLREAAADAGGRHAGAERARARRRLMHQPPASRRQVGRPRDLAAPLRAA
jgi:crotonobetainyl-CoA:carnitine CoA-transferase CaiB-like acyl-CoA transferase